MHHYFFLLSYLKRLPIPYQVLEVSFMKFVREETRLLRLRFMLILTTFLYISLYMLGCISTMMAIYWFSPILFKMFI